MSYVDRPPSLLADAPVGAFHTDPDGHCLFVNARWCEIAGMPLASARGEGWVKALDPEDRERVQQDWQDATARDRTFHSEYRLRRPDGTRTWVLGQALPQRDGDGTVTGYLGTITDITQQKAVQAELRASEERLALALNATAEAVWEWDVASGRIDFAPRARGYTTDPSAADVATLQARIHPDDLPELLRALRAHLDGLAPIFESEHRQRDPSGGWTWNLHRGRVVERDAQGRPRRVVGVDIDIRERKRSEEELRRRQTQLRTLATRASLAEERERRRIAADLHDGLGQTLAVARLKLGALRKRAASDDLVQRSQEVADLLEEAIRETRSLSFELGSPVLHQLGLEPAIEALSAQLTAETPIDFRFDASPGPVELSEELRLLLYRAVRELLFNVRKHAGARRVEVCLRSRADRIVIEVGDDGVGFVVPQGPEVFAPKAGLGLFHVRESLAHFGGSLAIESAPGRGTRATLAVPLADAPESP